MTPATPASHDLLTREQWQGLHSRFNLSAREVDVVRAIFDGHSESEVGSLLGISPNTVHTHVRHIYRKVAVRDRGQLIVRVIEVSRNGHAGSPGFRGR